MFDIFRKYLENYNIIDASFSKRNVRNTNDLIVCTKS